MFVPSNKHSEEKGAVNCVKHTGVNENQNILFFFFNEKPKRMRIPVAGTLIYSQYSIFRSGK